MAEALVAYGGAAAAESALSLVGSILSSPGGQAAAGTALQLAGKAANSVLSSSRTRAGTRYGPPSTPRKRPDHAPARRPQQNEPQDEEMQSEGVASSDSAATGEGQLGQGTALAHPLPGIRMPLLDGEMTFRHRALLTFPSNVTDMLDFQGDAFNFWGWRRSGFYAIPVCNTALYLSAREAMNMKEIFTHYKYNSAGVRLSNFQSHATSLGGTNAPTWNMNSSGVLWMSGTYDSNDLGTSYTISNSDTPHFGIDTRGYLS